MAEYPLTFKKDTPIWKLYQELKRGGVQDETLDMGYPDTDYVHQKRTQIQAVDHVIQEPEVLNYALDRYEKYQQVIQETTGYVVPWSLDDLDPKTKSDELIRQRATHAIQAFRDILTSKGLSAETDRYQELMGLSLYAFAMAGKQFGISKASIPEDLKVELVKEGLEKVVTYLESKGGIGFALVTQDCAVEATALEALEKGCGWCTEGSSILYPLFRMAGLKANFMFGKAKPDIAIRLKNIPKLGGRLLHVSVALFLDKRVRYFDMALKRSDGALAYSQLLQWWIEWSNRDFMSAHYSNLGADYGDKKEWDLAINKLKAGIALDPHHADTYYNLGVIYARKGELDKAIEVCEQAIEIDSELMQAHDVLGLFYTKKGNVLLKSGEKEVALRFYEMALKELKIAVVLGSSSSDVISFVKDKIEGLKIGKIEEVEEKPVTLSGAEEAYNEGEEFYKQDKLAEALKSYKKAAELDPKFTKAWMGIWQTYRAMNDKKNAKLACEQYSRVAGDDSLDCER